MNLIELVSSLVSGGEGCLTIAAFGSSVVKAFEAHQEAWSQFEVESIMTIADDYKTLCDQLRKNFCTYYSGKISNHLRRYFKKLAKIDIYSVDDPADIHPEFVAIAKLLLEANSL